MQQSNKNMNTTHVKVTYNNEWRRFALETLSFSQLESTLRMLYSLGDSVQLKVKFQDDEKDWVLLSSDEELSYAVEFGLPLRLSFVIVETPQKPAPVVPPTDFQNSAAPSVTIPVFPEPSPSPFGEATVPVRGGRGRGRGRAGVNGLTMQDRLIAKSSRLNERIQALESRLAENPSLSSERQRVLRWRLVQLQSKLSAVQEKKASIDMAVGAMGTPAAVPTPSPENTEPAEEPHGFGLGNGPHGHGPHGHGPHGHGPHGHGPHGHGPHGHGPHGHGPHGPGPHGCGRGRGRGRGARGGRGVLQIISHSEHPDVVDARDAFTKFRQCKVDLKVARKSGDLQAIESCEAAFKVAQKEKKESLGNILAAQRAHKRECAQNLKFARKSGNQEQIKSCETALFQAITELKQAKAEILNF